METGKENRVVKKWWNDKIAYQIYPKSFCDSNGDGIGDLPGIISKLDYLKELGIDMVWLSPIYQSPFVDQGYDISDYYAIDPVFGTMEDFDRLVAEMKKRDMHLIMDLVLNHCSDKHWWFQEAIKDPKGKYGEYFYMREGKDGKAPSNYRSYFGGSAWEPVPGWENLYYLHMFAKEQPDLNWGNPQVRQDIYDMINWWSAKGVSGFRLDAIINVKKDTTFPSYEPDGDDGMVTCSRMVQKTDGVGELLEDMKAHTFATTDSFTVGEVFDMHEGELEEFIGPNGHFSTIFEFSAHGLTFGEHGWYDSKKITFAPWRRVLLDAQKEVEDFGFYANIIENHDEPRGASRYLPSYAQNDAGKKMLATTSILLRGVPFLYQGQEIGMTNCNRETIEEYEDISTRDQYKVALAAGCGKDHALQVCRENSRDNARTPVQWSDESGAGFTTGTPWLALNPNYREINVASQEANPDSVLSYYKKLLALRKNPAYGETFTYGKVVPVFMETEQVFAYLRVPEEDTEKTVLIAANYGAEAVRLTEKDGAILGAGNKKILLNNMPERPEVFDESTDALQLESCQVIVAENSDFLP